MRIVTWNCRSAFDSKAEALFALRPDLAIVPESNKRPACTSPSLLAPVPAHAWSGKYPAKGLGLFAPRGVLRPLANDGAGRWSVAAEAEIGGSTIGVLAMWTLPLVPSQWGSGYIAATLDILDRHRAWFATRPCIVAGDFNVSAGSDPKAIIRFMQAITAATGLTSAYHRFHRVEPGGEGHSTLWFRGKREDAFHCDFVFVPETWTITGVDVGGYDEWGAAGVPHRSDHAPVIVDVELPDDAGSHS